MENILNIDCVSDYYAYARQNGKHPLVGVIDLSLSPPVPHIRKLFNCYAVFLKDIHCGDMRYGCSKYDYEKGSLLFIGTGQVAGAEGTGMMTHLQGQALIFHPDLLLNTPLGKSMKRYRFFSYDATEALHLSEKERGTVNQCLEAITNELDHETDTHSATIITTWIQVLLEHCLRFYDRQFTTRKIINHNILAKLDLLMEDYFNSDAPRRLGIPTVAYLAKKLNLSANYFGDLVKRETGHSARSLIQRRLIAEAKARLSSGQQNVSETAFSLGFRYPHHLTRLFKDLTGSAPSEWRSS